MNIYIAASLFSLIILLYWIMSELFTMLFKLIGGLPEEKARFQVTSLLTGCGFTTRESEMLLTTKRRRRLARITMLFGYVFNISIVTALINMFLSLKSSQFRGRFLGLLIPFAAIALFILLLRIRPVRAWLDTTISDLAGSFVKSRADNSVMLVDHIGKGAIAQVTLRTVPEELKGVELAKTGLKERSHILIMLVEHSGQCLKSTGQFGCGGRPLHHTAKISFIHRVASFRSEQHLMPGVFVSKRFGKLQQRIFPVFTLDILKRN